MVNTIGTPSDPSPGAPGFSCLLWPGSPFSDLVLLESVFHLSCLLSLTLYAALTELLDHCNVETYRVVNLLSWSCPLGLDMCSVPCVLIVGSPFLTHSHT